MRVEREQVTYVNREGGIIRFDDGVGDLWGGDNGECGHHSIWVFFADFADQEGAHTSTSTTTERMCYLEALETVASFGFASNNVQDLID